MVGMVERDQHEKDKKMVEDGKEESSQAKISYNESLAGMSKTRNKEFDEAQEGWAPDDDEVKDAEKDQDCLSIQLTKGDEKKRIRYPWKQMLIIKVWGRTMGYNYLLRRLKTMWRPKEAFDLIAINNEYFLVQFASSDDYAFTKFESPWMVLDHSLVVKEWALNSDLSMDKTEKLIVWMQLPCLSIKYFDDFGFLQKVGEKIGKPI